MGPPNIDGGDDGAPYPPDIGNPALYALINILMIWTVGWFIWD